MKWMLGAVVHNFHQNKSKNKKNNSISFMSEQDVTNSFFSSSFRSSSSIDNQNNGHMFSGENKEENILLSTGTGSDIFNQTSASFSSAESKRNSSCNPSDFNYFVESEQLINHKAEFSILPNSNTNESITTNYMSMEKYESILKPQSKDYILCFDTSSIIDHNSSVNSTDDNHDFLSAHDFMILNKSISSEKSDLLRNHANKETELVAGGQDMIVVGVGVDRGGKAETSCTSNIEQIVIEKKVIVVNYPDSGIDTARTLSPQIFAK